MVYVSLCIRYGYCMYVDGHKYVYVHKAMVVCVGLSLELWVMYSMFWVCMVMV